MRNRIVFSGRPALFNQDLLDLVRKADDPCREMNALAKSTEWLKTNGYRPVSGLGLMWVKDVKSS